MTEHSLKKKAFIFALSLFLNSHVGTPQAAPSSTASESEGRLAIVVGKKAISAYDLHQRLRLAALSSGLQATPDVLNKIKNAIISIMIDEQLQIDEALRFNIQVSSEEIQQAIENLEKANHMPAGAVKKFLADQQIPLKTMENQIRANLLWMKYSYGKWVASLPVRQQDIDTYLKISQANQEKTHYHLAEIVLYVEKLQDEKKVYQQAVQLIQMLQQGAPFIRVAHQFSQAPTSPQGGDMGWVVAEDLDPALQEALNQQEAGKFLGPLRTREGFTIIAYIEKQDPQKGKTMPLPSREEVLQLLQNERLQMLSRRELSQLRRKTFIDIRS